MSTYRFANNAATTLGSAISPTATSITVASGTGSKFPAPAAGQFFTATLFASATGSPNEIVRVTARTGDTMTVVRAQEGTTAQSWGVGNTFANFITAGFLNQLVDAGSLQSQSSNYAVDTGTANAAVVTLVPVPASLAALVGVPVRVKKVGATSTGAFTINVNGTGVTPVLIGGQALEGGEVVGSEIFEVIFDGAQFNLISNPGTLHGDRLVANSVSNAALVPMPSLTLKGNLSGGTANQYDVPLADISSQLGTFFAGGATWNNYTGARSYGTTYTNGHGALMMVSVCGGPPGGSGSANLRAYVNGVIVAQSLSNFNNANLTFVVPPGSTYQLINSSSYLVNWAEFF